MLRKGSEQASPGGGSAEADVHDLVVLFQDRSDWLEVQTLEAIAIGVLELDSIILQAPLPALYRHDIVDLLEELRNGGVGVGGQAPDKLHFRHRVAADGQAKAHLGGQDDCGTAVAVAIQALAQQGEGWQERGRDSRVRKLGGRRGGQVMEVFLGWVVATTRDVEIIRPKANATRQSFQVCGSGRGSLIDGSRRPCRA